MLFDICYEIKKQFWKGWVGDIRNPLEAANLDEIIEILAKEDTAHFVSIKIIARS